jgi:hypothetical protein
MHVEGGGTFFVTLPNFRPDVVQRHPFKERRARPHHVTGNGDTSKHSMESIPIMARLPRAWVLNVWSACCPGLGHAPRRRGVSGHLLTRLNRNNSIGSAVLARSAPANPSSFASYEPCNGARLARFGLRKHLLRRHVHPVCIVTAWANQMNSCHPSFHRMYHVGELPKNHIRIHPLPTHP